MLRACNVALLVVVLGLAFVLYSLEHRMRAGERAVADLDHEIGEEREMIRLLEAEWSYLTRPARLERLAREHAGMAPLAPPQVVPLGDLASRIPERPAPNPAESPDDPLADLLEVLQ
ncbi:MAG: cell division protein FtsL [Hyphomicrobiales bacterium]